MLTIKVFGPAPDMQALAKVIESLPSECSEVVIKAPVRNEPNRRPCQHPNWLTYEASADNKFFVTVIQKSVGAAYEVTKSKA